MTLVVCPTFSRNVGLFEQEVVDLVPELDEVVGVHRIQSLVGRGVFLPLVSNKSVDE